MNTERPSLPQMAARMQGYDPESLPVSTAQAFILGLATCVETIDCVPLRGALGRVLAHDLHATFDVPPHDNSAMDGYALRATDLRTDAPTVLRESAHAWAGAPASAVAAPGECVRIMTGAMMPAGLDTVVPQELVTRAGGIVTLPCGVVRPGDNRRLAGEDLAQGEVALVAGRQIRPADLGLIASLGFGEVKVRRRLRVAFFSTGNELRSIGEPLTPGCIYDSNRHTLWAMLQRLGVVEPLDMGVIRDDPVALQDAFRSAAQTADVVLTSGGVSMGEADHTRQVMAQLGDVLFWQLAMRPGRPLAIGRLAAERPGSPGPLWFGLPGNPVAVMVTFYALVREALLRMSGCRLQPLPTLRAVSVDGIRKKPGRTEFQRGILTRAPSGDWQVQLTGPQGSGMLHSMSQADGLVLLGHEQGAVAAGDWVEVLPFEGLI